jgi:hypothetical protein
MHLIKLTDELIEQARREAHTYNTKNSNRTDPEKMFHARLGELAYHSRYGGEYHNKAGYDFAASGYTIEIKTKKCNCAPRPTDNAMVYVTSCHQKPDLLYFVRVDPENKKAYLCGGIWREDFYKKATLSHRGDREGMYEFTADCYNLPIYELT